MSIPLALIVLPVVLAAGLLILHGSNSTVAGQDDLYLTPIPAGTLAAYRQGRPIKTRLDAVIAARAYVGTADLQFTRGDPIVLSAERTDFSGAWAHLPPSSPYHDFKGPKGNTPAWLVIFKGQWQVVPPGSHDLLPLESGCIYVILNIQEYGMNQVDATSCTASP